MKTNFSKKESGFELVEVVLASGILSLALLSIIGIAGRSIIVSRRALDTYTAANLLEEGAEVMRIVRDGGWGNITSLSTSVPYYPAYDTTTDTWSLSTTPSTVDFYTRSIVMTDVNRDGGDDVNAVGSNDPGTKLFTETISWKESNGSTQTKTLVFYLMDVM